MHCNTILYNCNCVKQPEFYVRVLCQIRNCDLQILSRSAIAYGSCALQTTYSRNRFSLANLDMVMQQPCHGNDTLVAVFKCHGVFVSFRQQAALPVTNYTNHARLRDKGQYPSSEHVQDEEQWPHEESQLYLHQDTEPAPSCTFNKNNSRKVEASEPDVSVLTSYVGNRIRSYLITSKMLIG